MGCLSHRKKQTEEFQDQKWDYISLHDFKAKGCGTPFAYGYLWFLLILSVAFYAVDVFTAVNLLVFNRWASQVEPAIDFDILKYIFSVCIILSIINLVYEGIRASRVMKRGNVAECYLDSLAVRWECIRFGSGQGWRRFLVFAELTKSKKGAEYIALFTYFSFQSWIRVLLCSGPRQVVNVLTLKSVYEAKFNIKNETVEGSISEFFEKIKVIAEEDYRQAVILSGMCFTIVIWAFSIMFLIAAVLFYVFFLFHWIPRADGGLSGYCERKVNKALLKIVTDKVNKALAKGQIDRVNAARKNGEKVDLERMATLPTLPNVEPVKGDTLPFMPMLERQNTTSTLPAYTPGSGAPSSFELGQMDQKRPIPSRTATMASDVTYSSQVSLLGGAADMGYGRASPAPQMPDLDPRVFPLRRSETSDSQRSIRQAPGTDYFSESPLSTTGSPFAGPVRSQTARTLDSYNRPMLRDNNSTASVARQFQPYIPDSQSQWDSNPGSRYQGSSGPPQYQPARSATGPMLARGPQQPPRRNLTAPNERFMDRTASSQGAGAPAQSFNRPGTSQSQRGPYGYDMNGQRDRMY